MADTPAPSVQLTPMADMPQTHGNRLTTILIAAIVILVIVLMAYRMKWLNWMLPAKYGAGRCPPMAAKANFVGTLSRTDQGKPTLIYATSHARWPLVNLGTYV